MINILVIFKLYCPMGSAMAPDTAGPTTRPIPNDAANTDIPKAWFWSLQFADIAALALPTIPENN